MEFLFGIENSNCFQEQSYYRIFIPELTRELIIDFLCAAFLPCL